LIGRTLSHFRITAKLGEGGMGEVYLAEDTKLGRDVAIKVLPMELSGNEQRLARLEREAKLLATLNHPNVATLHGFEQEDDIHFLVMERVEGEDLAERLTHGPIPLEEASRLAIQIAEGLEAAHQSGVVHRDLKPANIKVTQEGRVKVLDFGLAKVIGSEVASVDLTQSPTLTAGPTGAGALLGTAPYMSPEQARGQEVDRQADIWSFGCVLYEMLTGKRPFQGETPPDILVAVLGKDPDWNLLPAEVPIKVRDLLRRCLQKKSRDRLHDIADARIEIKEALNDPVAPNLVIEGVGQTPTGKYRMVIAALAVLVALSAALAVKSWIDSQDLSLGVRAPTRFVITLPEGQNLVGWNPFDLSRDGNALVYSAAEPGEPSQIYLRFLDQFEARPLSGTEGGEAPFFSPNGQWVGFFGEEGTLEKVTIDGGPVRKIRGVETKGKFGATWGEDGTIVFVAGITAGLEGVSAEGGESRQLTVPKQTEGEIGHWYPSILPNSRDSCRPSERRSRRRPNPVP
jgi:serine/threonine-protein kinase